MRLKISILVMAAMLLAATVHAHHAAAPIFDQDREVEVKGVVKTWRFVNPHPILLIDVKDDKGQTVEWGMHFPAATSLSKRGWTDHTFKAGEVVIAKGHPSKAAGTHGLEAGTVKREDGKAVP